MIILQINNLTKLDQLGDIIVINDEILGKKIVMIKKLNNWIQDKWIN